MRRVSVHAVFAALALAAAGVAVGQGLRLQQLQGLNDAIAATTREPLAKDAPAAARDAPRELRLARATALAQAGAHDAAFKSYSGLIEGGAFDGTARHALYNLGNMYLRQALGPEPAAGADPAKPSAEAGPLIELAKQRYRDLLRADAGDWDARYNLERALRLAPEEQQASDEEDNVPVERRRVMLRGMDPGDLP